MVAQGLPPLAAVDAPTHGPLRSPGEDQGDALLPPVLHAYGIHGCIHGMMAHRRPVQTWMACQSNIGCMRQVHACAPTGGTTVCTCAHYAGSSDPSHCPPCTRGEGAGMCGWPQLACRPSSAEGMCPVGGGWPADAPFSTLAANRLLTAL